MTKSQRKKTGESELSTTRRNHDDDGGGGGDHVLIYPQAEVEEENFHQHQRKSTCSLDDSIKKMKQNSGTIVLTVLPLLLTAVIVGWVVVPCFIQSQISNKVVISPEANPELYSAWVHPPVPVYLKVYLFNVTNPEEVRKGALPQLQELGPYVFSENRTKVQITHDDASDTVTYKEHISYHFEPELSGEASLQDVVTIVNVPFVAAAIKIAHELPWPFNSGLITVLAGFKEKLFIQKTVDEALFKGWKVDFLERIEQDITLSLIPDNRFGFLIGQNATAQGPYTVSRGSQNKALFGTILKFKNESELEFWGDRSSSCNQIRGTDGTIFQPFVTRSTVLRLFNAELCRSLYLTYEKDTEFGGIKAYRFTAPPSVLQAPAEGEENRCFCSDVDTEPEKCLKQGTLDLGPCREGAPVAMSTPHFLDGDHKYIEQSGLVPDREKHETYMKIEPLTGVILDASKKIQINLMLKKVSGLASLNKVPEMLFPLVWMDECATLDDENKEKFKTTLFHLRLVDSIAKWGLLGLALIGSAVVIFRKLRPKQLDSPIIQRSNNAIIITTATTKENCDCDFLNVSDKNEKGQAGEYNHETETEMNNSGTNSSQRVPLRHETNCKYGESTNRYEF